MKKIDFSKVTLTGGFLHTKQELVKSTTVRAVYDRFVESHRFDALNCDWKEKGEYEAHFFWDSDVAKWIEGVAYLLKTERNDELEKIVDDTVDTIVRNCDEHGYFNSYFLTIRQDERFCVRDCHELYCAGHLIEAAIAYRDATGKDKFLRAMCRYADYIEKIFKIERSAKFITPGHPELELALVKLYDATGETRYLELAKYFIDEHGKHSEFLHERFTELYNMDDMPLRERTTAEGHSVRALYLMCGMADIADKYNDKELRDACLRLYENITTKRMYITGGIGSTRIGEAFTVDYDLPSRTAYAETCASIAMALFCVRMQKLFEDARYADAIERVIYNGILSGISCDGTSFFYVNPLEIDPAFNNVNVATTEKAKLPITQRVKLFKCSCCPPNLVRFFSSLGDYIYSQNEDTIFVNQYAASTLCDGATTLTQETDYPVNNVISIHVKTDKKHVALRIPSWCKKFSLNLDYTMKNGYAFVEIDGSADIRLELDMPVVAIAANRKIHDCAGKIAVMRGPVVYCAEAVDNGDDLASIAIDKDTAFNVVDGEFILPSIEARALKQKPSDTLYNPAADDYEPVTFKLIPYHAFANRGESEMRVWLTRKI